MVAQRFKVRIGGSGIAWRPILGVNEVEAWRDGERQGRHDVIAIAVAGVLHAAFLDDSRQVDEGGLGRTEHGKLLNLKPGASKQSSQDTGACAAQTVAGDYQLGIHRSERASHTFGEYIIHASQEPGMNES